MRWSFKIGSIFGIPVRVHATFLLLLLFVGFSPSDPNDPWSAGLRGLVLVGLVFVCVFLHELGHSLAARSYGIGVESITLLPIGGLAALKGLPDSPRAELITAIAGPAVSVGLGVLFALGVWIFLGPDAWRTILHNPDRLPLLAELAMINFFLVAFNLLPAFPMDGGRILRAALWSRKGFVRATRIAVTVGQGLAGICFVLALIHFRPWLILIALFIYFGAEAEGRLAAWKEAFQNQPVRQIMQSVFETIPVEQTVEETARFMARTGQEHFFVREGDQVAGILTGPALLRAIRDRQSDHPVKDFMTRELICCRPTDNVASVWEVMERRNLACIVVIEEDRIVGLVTPEMTQSRHLKKE